MTRRLNVLLVILGLGCSSAEEVEMPGDVDAEKALVIRTHFADDAGWRSACGALRRSFDGASAPFLLVDDRQYEGLLPAEVRSRVSRARGRGTVFLVDEVTLRRPGHPVVVVDLVGEASPNFRAVASEVAGVWDNLSLANMDFSEFANAADEDGVFRGFRRP
jgi:hypothetical protein